ncbi:MAG TPA: hypothetical protein PKC39_11300 [Ferruginibacter sp.]|nr:hypothetical protein [Ferruginibacter sp.]HMP21535.1 hypothetical protein [Ferruginibacter sp.]
MRILLIVISFCVYQNIGYSQKKEINTTKVSITDTLCHYKFIENQVKYFRTIFLPVIIEGDTLRMKINGVDLYSYLKQINTEPLDTSSYFNLVYDYLNKKKYLMLNRLFFQSFVKNGVYQILEKKNPYIIEIRNTGLKKLLSKVFRDDFYSKDYYTYYNLTSKINFNRINEYNLLYLEESLFEYSFLVSYDDMGVQFVKYNYCGNG